MSTEDKYIKELGFALDGVINESPLIPEKIRYATLLGACINILKKNNYAVIKQPKAAARVKNSKNLVDLYYHLLQFKYGGSITPCRNDKVDFTIAKLFVTKIQNSSKIERDMALSKCVKIIEGVFKYSKELNIHPEVLTSFRLFGQGKLGWITERVISLLNNKLYDDSDWINKVDKDTEKYAEDNNIEFGLPNLEELANKVRRNLNGKKENRKKDKIS